MTQVEIIAAFIGLAVGVVVTWLLMRNFIASAQERGRTQMQAENAVHLERIRALEEERQAHQRTYDDLKGQAQTWRDELDAERDERAQLQERAARVPQLEGQIATQLDQQRNDQVELRRMSVNEAERAQQLAAANEQLHKSQRDLEQMVQDLAAARADGGQLRESNARIDAELAAAREAQRVVQNSLDGERAAHQSTADELRIIKSELSATNEMRAGLEEKVGRLPRLENELQELQSQLAAHIGEMGDLRENLGRSESQLAAERKDAEARRSELLSTREALRQSEALVTELKTQAAELQANLEAERSRTVEQLALLTEAKNELSNQFKALANDILDEKSKKFLEHNESSLGQLLNPLRERMTEFKSKVEEIHAKDLEQQATLRAELGQLKDLNRQITEEAHGLAVALKGQAKMQGNWGELVLGNVLDRAGLCEGKDYRREPNFNTEEGRRRPDVVLQLPQNKHLVIDAKVSLNAYTRYVNADEPAERAQALKEHVAAIASRIQELSDRSYFELPGLNTPEMVFMFIPIESAFVEALRADESLFQRAIEQSILVATPTTLLTSLNIVRQLWRFEEQNAHTAELADKAAKVYKKLVTFVGSMESLGKQLDRARESYTQAMGQLVSGKGNLIQQAKDFERLGVSVQSQLPAPLAATAALELDHIPYVENGDGQPAVN